MGVVVISSVVMVGVLVECGLVGVGGGGHGPHSGFFDGLVLFRGQA